MTRGSDLLMKKENQQMTIVNNISSLNKQSFRGTKLVNGFEKSKHLEKLKLFV